ncbi:hypothetical protein [Desulfosporosinus sp. BG]|uniref:hypothetical protein n=1 Tax=Desulfosporosinus sp. BG TaxID=1633135 RepID=UPI000855D236|nr:hypothetical protein [Desulfosporosinus sp. BG]ODA39195.1 hypothetical protein DSBG_4048 [Desulfosporosinus sp. BG]
MATLGKNINTKTNFVPRGNTPKPGIINPESEVILEKLRDNPKGNSTDPGHN